MLVQIKVGEARLRMLVDTGARDLVLFENRLQGRLRTGIRAQSEHALHHAGGQSRVKKALLHHVRIGDAQLEKTWAYLLEVPDHTYPGLDGVLGPFSLGAKRIQFDFKEGVLGWER